MRYRNQLFAVYDLGWRILLLGHRARRYTCESLKQYRQEVGAHSCDIAVSMVRPRVWIPCCSPALGIDVWNRNVIPGLKRKSAGTIPSGTFDYAAGTGFWCLTIRYSSFSSCLPLRIHNWHQFCTNCTFRKTWKRTVIVACSHGSLSRKIRGHSVSSDFWHRFPRLDFFWTLPTTLIVVYKLQIFNYYLCAPTLDTFGQLYYNLDQFVGLNILSRDNDYVIEEIFIILN